MTIWPVDVGIQPCTDKCLGDISVSCHGDRLTMSNRHFQMDVLIDESSLIVQKLVHHDATDESWVTHSQLPVWSLPQFQAFGAPGEPELDVQTICDHPLLTDQMVVSVTYYLSSLQMRLRYQFTLYPNVAGLRTQLKFQFETAHDPEHIPSWLGDSLSLQLAMNLEYSRRLGVGFYNDTQHRNSRLTPIRRAMQMAGMPDALEIWDWNNILYIERHNAGLAIVKESHKTVNQNGIDGGAFLVEKNQLGVSGLGLCSNHYQGTAWHDLPGWRETWANWLVFYRGDQSARQLAIKQFDRARYPFKPQRDAIVMSNTWGSRGSGERSRQAADQANVLREIDSAADLGIDLVQIDDGWQCEPAAIDPTSIDRDWLPNPEKWPDGWQALVSHAQAKGVRLGLWFNSHVDVQKMLSNLDAGGFVRFKLDFANCQTRDELEGLLAKAKVLASANESDVRVNWDLTENAPRVGYFIGREFGSLYLANRENGPEPLHRLNHIRYVPSLILRDAWHLAHDLNLNQFQISYQNLDLVIDDLSNCKSYTHDYALAITLMGLPILFTETQRLSDLARAQIRPLLALYRQYREAMTRGYVFPLGQTPSDHVWTGFQSYDPDSQDGHILLFRELHNADSSVTLPLHFAQGKQVQLQRIWSSNDMLMQSDHSSVIACSHKTAVAGWYSYQLK
ncbi:MAG TPA: hypothetical protein DER01_05265 [Phycisphaerales bacterium]|nr:hypothetical protein [Phycisphaerales bacterium]